LPMRIFRWMIPVGMSRLEAESRRSRNHVRRKVIMKIEQEAEHPAAKWVAAAVKEAAEKLMIEAGSMPLPTAHMFMDDQPSPYVGYVATRPFYRGKDASAAIGRLGALPAALYATRLVLTWEHADLYTALEMPGDVFPTALALVEATLTTHTLTWHPFALRWGDVGSLGVPTAIPTWAPWSKHREGQLPAPINAALNDWRRLKGGEIGATITKLQREKFVVKLIDPT
jgi:hypothetical protein